MKHLIFVLSFCATPLFADCPAVTDHSSEMERLFEQARAAPNDMAGRGISDKMWQIWLQAPDEAAQATLDRGMRQREVSDFVGALDEFSRLVAYCPHYAEGFNQRAFIHFLRKDYANALSDLDQALALSPFHVGARSGRALSLMSLGRIREAREDLLLALENNPWLSERFLMSQGGPLALPGKDI
ncbi:hypothetical protein ROLI_014760 [Roseobacter fucihabitans]|uniref:TPR domain protein n=1 Tax=Roseobacter fucihabitans TaxID=1537242 RepID=A0ABZ2BRD1_9RHOB|nr:tetratricopeptide repeat protein [Roseobacter litoralis]MBC6968329.1 Tetratricopeptide repeat protein [Roseobacter litoralis]